MRPAVRMPREYKFKEGDKVKFTMLIDLETENPERWERVKRYQGMYGVVVRDQDEDNAVLIEVDKKGVNPCYMPKDDKGHYMPVQLREFECPTEILALPPDIFELWDIEEYLKQLTDRELLAEYEKHRKVCSPCGKVLSIFKKELALRPHIPRGRKGRLWKIEQGKKSSGKGKRDK